MADDGKRSEMVCTKLTERMFIDLGRLAALDDRSLSDLLFMMIRRELYGRTVKLAGESVDIQDQTK
jgi:hypothetical protein